MNMKKCMTCGMELNEKICTGKIGGMEVDFCDEHAGYCENCETITCKVVK